MVQIDSAAFEATRSGSKDAARAITSSSRSLRTEEAKSPNAHTTMSQKPSSSSMSAAIRDPDSAVFSADGGRKPLLGFAGYSAVCTIATCLSALLSVLLWSDMGCSDECLLALRRQSKFSALCTGCALGLAILLYLLDFFMPPHIPGAICVFYEGDRWLGRAAVFALVLLLLGAGLLSGSTYSTVPLAITIFLCPIGLLLVRHVTMPAEQFHRDAKDVDNKNFQERMAMLRVLTGEEKDQREFYRAAMVSFLIAGFLCLAVWIPWAAATEPGFNREFADHELQGNGVRFVLWVSPLIVGLSNLVFAAFAWLRVTLNEAYSATDQVKNQLIVGQANSNMNDELMMHRMAMLQQAFQNNPDLANSPKRAQAMMAAQDRMQRYLVQHISHMRQLSAIVKTVGCAFIVILGAMYVAFQLTAADSEVAHIVQGFLVAFFITFTVFVYVSFNRLWRCMHLWLRDLPLWASAVNVSRSSWCRGLVFTVAFPIFPLVMGLSAVNQLVRKCRGLADFSNPEVEAPKEEKQGNAVRADTVGSMEGGFHAFAVPETPKAHRPSSKILTERVGISLASLQDWDWLSVVRWLYVWSWVVFIWKLVGPLLNVMLAWMSALMGDQNFIVILAFTFAAGMVLFMIPPVPGPPIYLFGGFVISDKCPFGFWWGSFICIILCFVLKLTACAVQQSLIGARLGDWKSVRQMCGVHKPFVRAIESVLRRPGLSFGKCVILCGGPDWPTSVMAGILRLSLAQCLLGTCPIIINLIPLTLTGSFYLRRSESEVWTRAGNLMFTLTVLTSVIFWAGMGWAIQNEFDTKLEELTKPKEEFLELDWLDYRATYIAQRCAVDWQQVPRGVRFWYALGALGSVLAAQFLFWRFASCVGAFAVTDDIDELIWYGKDGLFKLQGLIVIGVAAVAGLGLTVFRCWQKKYRLKPAAEAEWELKGMEGTWKDRRLAEARNPSRRFCSSMVGAGVGSPNGLEEGPGRGGGDAGSGGATCSGEQGRSNSQLHSGGGTGSFGDLGGDAPGHFTRAKSKEEAWIGAALAGLEAPQSSKTCPSLLQHIGPRTPQAQDESIPWEKVPDPLPWKTYEQDSGIVDLAMVAATLPNPVLEHIILAANKLRL